MKDIIGNRYGLLTVIERAGTKNKVQLIRCKCDCGKECVVRYPNLISGITTSCGCVKRQATSERFLKDLTGQTFGELTVIKRFSQIGGKKVKWLCRCSCGSTCVVQGANLKSGNSTSCGCKRASVNESIIIKALRDEHIVFEKEVKFTGLKASSGRPLRFDFMIYLKNNSFFLLEYQGEQHFYPGHWLGIGRTERKYTDEMKVNFCKEYNIKLEFITHEENTLNKLYHILSLYDVLYANTVPSSSGGEGVTTIPSGSTLNVKLI